MNILFLGYGVLLIIAGIAIARGKYPNDSFIAMFFCGLGVFSLMLGILGVH